jgi:hypothetical protein
MSENIETPRRKFSLHSRQSTNLSLQSSESGPAPPPHTQASVNSPPFGSEEAHSLAGDRHFGTLCVKTLLPYLRYVTS